MAFTPEIFAQINELIAQDVKDELRFQGHIATGELEESFHLEQLFEGGSAILEAKALGYIEELEKGVPAARINISPGEFGKLVKWVLFRGLAENITKARQVAYFIVRKWKKEGKPLDTSKQFSQTGEILHAIQIAFEENRDKHAASFNQLLSFVFTQDLKSRIKNKTI